ncbi:hypothetical protein D3C80_1187430 [compost metagenome]
MVSIPGELDGVNGIRDDDRAKCQVFSGQPIGNEITGGPYLVIRLLSGTNGLLYGIDAQVDGPQPPGQCPRDSTFSAARQTTEDDQHVPFP